VVKEPPQNPGRFNPVIQKDVLRQPRKGELWALTAGWRKKHAKNKVLRFEPTSSNGGIFWNPLDEIRLGTEFEVGDVQNLAQLIIDPDGKGLDSHWQKTAFALLVGVILHALYKAQVRDANGEKIKETVQLERPQAERRLWRLLDQGAARRSAGNFPRLFRR